MADRASAIIIGDKQILLIHRLRGGLDYYVFPGGHIEKGESAEQACVREVLEETGLQTAFVQFAFDYYNSPRLMHYFIVQIHPGELVLGGPEAQRQSDDNHYQPEWLPLSQLRKINLLPAAVRDALGQVTGGPAPMREAQDLLPLCARLIEILSAAAHRA